MWKEDQQKWRDIPDRSCISSKVNEIPKQNEECKFCKKPAISLMMKENVVHGLALLDMNYVEPVQSVRKEFGCQ